MIIPTFELSVLTVAILIACYFLGNINPAILLGRAYGVDVRKEGSGNAGTTNAMRTIGKKAGAVTFVVDALKGWLPVFAIGLLEMRPWGMLHLGGGLAVYCGLAVMFGHMFPAVFRFRGGKGVATAFGVILAIHWWIALILIGIVLVLAVITRRVSVSVLIACLCAIPMFYCWDLPDLFGMLLIIALIFIKHIPNIGRIFRGIEPKMSFGSKDKTAKGGTS